MGTAKGGQPSLFVRKVIARRAAVMTARGNEKVDAVRERLAKDLPELHVERLSLGDLFELLAHEYGDALTGDIARRVAHRINKQTEKDAAA